MLRPLLCIPVFTLLAAPIAENLVIKDTVGSSLRRSFDVEVSRNLDSVTQTVNGEERSGDVEESSTNSFRVVVVDHVDEVDGDRAKLFTRSFETIEGHVARSSNIRGRSNESEFDLISDIIGQKVQFRMEDGEWVAEAPDESGVDAVYLPGFVASLDFAEMVPPDEVAVGDTWDVSLDLIQVLTRPGGELGLHPEQQDDFSPDDILPEPERSGTITATYKGPSDDDDSLGIVELSVDVESTTDLTALMRAQIAGAPAPPGTSLPEIQFAKRTSALEGVGTALWDLRGHRLHSMDLTFESEETVAQEMTVSGPGGQQADVQSSQVSSGTLAIAIAQEAL